MKIKYDFVTYESALVDVDETLGNTILEIEKETRLHNRREKRKHTSFGVLEKYDLEPTHAPDYVVQAELARVKQAIALLTPDQKDLLYRVFFDGEDLVDIATADGVSYQAIQNRKNKALKRLRKILEN